MKRLACIPPLATALTLGAALAMPAAALAQNSPQEPSCSSECLDLDDHRWGLRNNQPRNVGNASGYRSTAFGWDALASAQESTAIGQGARSTGLRATAFGQQATASGGHSVALGTYARAWSPNTVAIGHSALASLTNATAVGQNSMAHRHATALGQYARAAEQFSIAIGQGSHVTAAGGTAIGRGARAGWVDSLALGAGARTERANQQVFGTTANTYTLPGLTSQASRVNQEGTIMLVTTDALGNLATDGGVFEARIAAIETALGITPTQAQQQQAAPEVAAQQAAPEPEIAAAAAVEPTIQSESAQVAGDPAPVEIAARQAQVTMEQEAQINANTARARENAKDIEENTDGVALAMALYSPALLADKKFAITMGYGHYKSAGALGISGSLKLTEDFYISLGGGFGFETTTAGGRAAVTFMR